MKKNCLTTVAALALLFLLTLSATTAGAATIVKVDPATHPDVTAGDSFSVNVSVENVTSMTGYQAVLNFDPTAMSVTDVTEGDFLKTNGTTFFIGIPIDNINGTAAFGNYLPGASVNGSGTLATINFDTHPAGAAGVYNHNLTDVMLLANDTAIMNETLNGTVNINARAVAPGLSGTGMVTLIGVLAVVLAVSIGATRKRRN